MNQKIFLKLLLGLLALAVLMKSIMTVFVEPRVGKKIQTALNEMNKDFTIEIGKAHLSMITRGIELEDIAIRSKQEHGDSADFNGKVASVKFQGLQLAKAIFKNDFDIREVTIYNSVLTGNLPLSKEKVSPNISPLNIRLGKVSFNQIDLAIKDAATAQSYSLKKGALTFYDLQVEKQDTLSPNRIREIDFEADELRSVSTDSMYTFKASGIRYSATSKALTADSIFIQPNYGQFQKLHLFDSLIPSFSKGEGVKGNF